MSEKGIKPREFIKEFTCVPNKVFDKIMRQLKPSEFMLYSIIIRKTYGFVIGEYNGRNVYKSSDKIACSQFAEYTGLTKKTVINNLNSLEAKGYIYSDRREGEISKFGVVLDLDDVRLDEEKQTEFEKIEEIKKEAGYHSINLTEQPEEDSEETKEDIVESINDELKEDMVSKDELVDDLMDELEEKPEENKPKKKSKKKKNKPVEEWNCNDLLKYFTNKYYEEFGLGYPSISGKERSLAKLLVEGDTDNGKLKKAVDYYMENYDQIGDGVPSSTPSWNIFYGYKETIIPKANLAEDKKNEENPFGDPDNEEDADLFEEFY